MIKLNELKKSYTNLFDEVKKTTDKFKAKPNFNEDAETYWKPQVDKAGNGGAQIRFLPGLPGDVPFVNYWSHSFRGPNGKYYIENCPTSLGPDHKCPVCEHNKMLWDSGNEKDRAIASLRKRKLTFVANIYVIKDKLNPETEGKVFKYRFGKKIFDMIDLKMNPPENEFNPEETEQPVNPFDPWEGCTFNLSIANVGGFWNYNNSKWSKPGSFLSDKELEPVLNQMYMLKSLIAPDQFKSYEELATRFERATGTGTTTRRTAEEVVEMASRRPTVQENIDVEDDLQAMLARVRSEE